VDATVVGNGTIVAVIAGGAAAIVVCPSVAPMGEDADVAAPPLPPPAKTPPGSAGPSCVSEAPNPRPPLVAEVAPPGVMDVGLKASAAPSEASNS
jgi:hypothetical protein